MKIGLFLKFKILTSMIKSIVLIYREVKSMLSAR